MALIAYLMENKGNYGPHLIIVPNAVMVNWKSELATWLPTVKCVYYAGKKPEREAKYNTDIRNLNFNVLVTTYEYIIRDEGRLSKIKWKYIIIDEAQRMKDRQSKLARKLDGFLTVNRLLLTGTPLQNDLKELWSLLNLLLPEVFDDKGFIQWFSEILDSAKGLDDYFEQEKRVVIVNRLHHILEPFMLRRQVEDVESKLPPKVPVVVKIPFSSIQTLIYNWLKDTGTTRLSPTDKRRGKDNSRSYFPATNRYMELRKVANHPALVSPELEWIGTSADVLRMCGKMYVLDRVLLKLYHTGHRVLLFSTMTKMLDIIGDYLRWRTVDSTGKRMLFGRIDGSTEYDSRESAIEEFNRPGSDVFIFLLSIRAAGRQVLSRRSSFL